MMSRKHALRYLLISFGIQLYALQVAAQPLGVRIDSLLAASQGLMSRIQVGLCVYDLTADSLVYVRGERQRMRPASNMKLVTAITALDYLGVDYRYRTVFSLDTSRIDSLGVLHDRLFVRGGMDPLLGRSDLESVARDLSRLGVREIEGGLCFDMSIKDSKKWGEGWCWDDDAETNPTLAALLCNGKPNFEDNLILALAREDIRVRGYASQSYRSEGAQYEIVMVRPVNEVLRPMMKQSDNLMAESLFYQIASASGGDFSGREAAAKAMEHFVARLGLVPSDYYFADGSGVSLYNYVSPELIVRLLRYAWQHGDIYEALLPTLPVAGRDGTLSTRMVSGPAAGNVKAKTGTCTGVSTLGGYATDGRGHRLCFSIMCQGQPSARLARELQDRICQELVR